MSELKFRPTAEIYDKFAMRALRDHDVAQAIYYIKRSIANNETVIILLQAR